jgi:hypothetical protein
LTAKRRAANRKPDESTDDRAAIERVVLSLAKALGESAILVGGFAVSAWGYVRATDDVDFVSRLPAADVVRQLTAAGIRSRVRKGTPEDDVPWCVSGTAEGIAFDILPPLVPIDFSQAVRIRLGSQEVRVVDLDGLSRLKLRAGGPQDLIDVVQLLRRHPELVAGIRTIAEKYGVWRQLDTWMKDSRLR